MDFTSIMRMEMAKKIPAVKIEVASLSNTQPPKPAKPPPQLAGAKRTKAAEKIIKGIANFFQELNTCSLRKNKINMIIDATPKNNQIGNNTPSPKESEQNVFKNELPLL